MDRLKHWEFSTIYSVYFILAVLFIVSIYNGQRTTWYQNLVKSTINPWIIKSLWILGFGISYIAFYLVWEDVKVHRIPLDFILSSLFLIVAFLFVLWSAVFFYLQSIRLALIVAFIIFIYNFWLFIYLWYINPFASIFLIPSFILYFYLLYDTIHTAGLNGVII